MISPEVARVVDEASQVILARVPGTPCSPEYTVRDLASAIYIVHGDEPAIDFAKKQIGTFGLPPSDRFTVLTGLVKNGSERAIPEARKAIGLASESVPFVEAIGALSIGSLHTAERLVALAVAGDKGSIDFARRMTDTAFPTEKTALFADLYMAGDAESRDLTIAAGQGAKEYCEKTGDMHYDRSVAALAKAGIFAASTGDKEGAVRFLKALAEEPQAADILAALYVHGNTEFEPSLIDAFNKAAPWKQTALMNSLAQGGNRQARDIIKRECLPRRVPRLPQQHDATSTLTGLRLLHKLGDKKAAPRVMEIVRQFDDPRHFLLSLGAVGLHGEHLELAERAFARNPTPSSAWDVYEAYHTPESWEVAFEMYLKDGRTDALSLSSDVLRFARDMKSDSPYPVI